MAKYPDVQNKLFEELNSNLADFLTDEAMTSQEYFEIVVNGSPYLDATIKETLRRYPPAIRIERRITSEKGYTISGVHLPKDTLIEISAYGNLLMQIFAFVFIFYHYNHFSGSP